MRVLVTDGLWQKSLATVRALGRQGIDVTVTGNSRFTTAFYSRYCKRRVLLPPANDRDRFYRGLLVELQRTPYDVTILMEDSTIDVVLDHRTELEQFTRFALPSEESFRIASDKRATMELAERLGIPTPKTFAPEDESELERLAAVLSFPVVIKPRRSSGSRGLRYAATPEELLSEYHDVAQRFPKPLIQERIPQSGQGRGAALLFDANHQPIAGFTYKRLREYPVSGGPSTLRESTHDPALLETATKLLAELKWHGVAMVEFKVDPRDGVPRLMEINPRFWGSLELAIASGVDFPNLLCRMAMGEAVEPTFEYKVGVRCRWLVPGDVLHFLSNPERLRLDPSFFQFAAQDLHYDDFRRDDVRGSIATIVCTAAHSIRPRMWKLAITR